MPASVRACVHVCTCACVCQQTRTQKHTQTHAYTVVYDDILGGHIPLHGGVLLRPRTPQSINIWVCTLILLHICNLVGIIAKIMAKS